MLQHYRPPVDGYKGTWVGLAWLPGPDGGPGGVVMRPDGVFDITRRVATTSALLDLPDPAGVLREIRKPRCLLARTRRPRPAAGAPQRRDRRQTRGIAGCGIGALAPLYLCQP